jgi:mannose-6-phosphate isomerase-like protein (cupin superfamily)
MYMTSKAKAPADAKFAKALGGGDIAARWLIHRDAGDAEGGKIGLVEAAPRATLSVPPDEGADQALFVLGGTGAAVATPVPTPFDVGASFFVPAGGSLGLRAGEEGLRLLLIHSGAAQEDAFDGALGPAPAAAPEIRMKRLDEVENVPFHEPKLGFLHVSARWLVTAESATSRALVVGQSSFAIGGAHLLHRHAHAEEFFYVFGGRGVHLIEGGAVPMRVGDIVHVPRNEWHGFRNTGSTPVRAVFGYLGVNTVDAAGYEVHESCPFCGGA